MPRIRFEASLRAENSWVRFVFGQFLLTVVASGFLWLGLTLTATFQNSNRSADVVGVVIFGFGPVATILMTMIVSISRLLSYPLVTIFCFGTFRRLHRIPLLLAFVITPLLGLLTWFGYDYLAPDYRWYTDESPPYQHGLTLTRFLLAWGVEAGLMFGLWLLLLLPPRRASFL